jgi:type II secretory pathway pseudopilin PulG
MTLGSPRQRISRRQTGFTFVAVLLLLALAMLGLGVAAPVWSQQAQREREQQLLRIGAIYAQALLSYRDASPGSEARFPDRLEALLVDPRYPGLRRHIRTLYEDPMNPGQPWGVVRDANGRIAGVHSLSDKSTLSRAAHDLGVVKLRAGARYSDWKFAPEVVAP